MTPQLCNTARAVSPPAEIKAPIPSPADVARRASAAARSGRWSKSTRGSGAGLSTTSRFVRIAFCSLCAYSCKLGESTGASRTSGGTESSNVSDDEVRTRTCPTELRDKLPMTKRRGPICGGSFIDSVPVAESIPAACGSWYASPAEPTQIGLRSSAIDAEAIARRSSSVSASHTSTSAWVAVNFIRSESELRTDRTASSCRSVHFRPEFASISGI